MTELLRVQNLSYHFYRGGGLFRKGVPIHAVNNISFSLEEGETLGLVGESGCGKSTLGRVLLKLLEPESGEIYLEGKPIHHLSRRAMRLLRQVMQIVFQDPSESLNARHTIGMIIEEPFLIHDMGTAQERQEWVIELLDKVGLSSTMKDRYPHELSGGQRQRVGIARAIALKPKLLVCDESVSALDVSVQAQILNLLLDLQKEMNLAIIFISHDLSVVRHISDRVAVMYLGEWVEVGSVQQIYHQSNHPYTQALLASIPITHPKYRVLLDRAPLSGDLPSLSKPPSGCTFHPRCPYATKKCQLEKPTEKLGVRCHYPLSDFCNEIDRKIS